MNIKVDDQALRRLKKIRRERGLSQKDLAVALGYAQSTVTRFESGRIPIPPLAVRPLAEKLGCSPDWLATGEGDPGLIPMELPEPLPKLTREEKEVMSVLGRLRTVVSKTVGFQITNAQALEWAIRKAGVGDAVYPRPK